MESSKGRERERVRGGEVERAEPKWGDEKESE
jgi:hypothetical protein